MKESCTRIPQVSSFQLLSGYLLADRIVSKDFRTFVFMTLVPLTLFNLQTLLTILKEKTEEAVGEMILLSTILPFLSAQCLHWLKLAHSVPQGSIFALISVCSTNWQNNSQTPISI